MKRLPLILVVLLLAGFRAHGASVPAITEMLGRPTYDSMTVNVRADADLEVYVEYGREPAHYTAATAPTTVAANQPLEIVMEIGRAHV